MQQVVLVHLASSEFVTRQLGDYSILQVLHLMQVNWLRFLLQVLESVQKELIDQTSPTRSPYFIIN